MVARCGSRVDRRTGGQRRKRYRRRQGIEVKQSNGDCSGKAGTDRAFGTVPVLFVIRVTGAMMMAAVVRVITPGVEELYEFGLRARGT